MYCVGLRKETVGEETYESQETCLTLLSFLLLVTFDTRSLGFVRERAWRSSMKWAELSFKQTDINKLSQVGIDISAKDHDTRVQKKCSDSKVGYEDCGPLTDHCELSRP